MKGQCCLGERPSGRLARRLSGAGASILSGAALVLLPKCPLCLAAWLTAATGVGVSAAAAARLRGLTVAVTVAAMAFAAAQAIWRSTRAHESREASHLGAGDLSYGLPRWARSFSFSQKLSKMSASAKRS